MSKLTAKHLSDNNQSVSVIDNMIKQDGTFSSFLLRQSQSNAERLIHILPVRIHSRRTSHTRDKTENSHNNWMTSRKNSKELLSTNVNNIHVNMEKTESNNIRNNLIVQSLFLYARSSIWVCKQGINYVKDFRKNATVSNQFHISEAYRRCKCFSRTWINLFCTVFFVCW